ncbi:hypothetical protein D5086_018424 [Populus alba]|uniref:Uncharacterized protein n=1 Tax=Populus alba TaxID=43335 RepID=A0ACC4BPR1_POPAL
MAFNTAYGSRCSSSNATTTPETLPPPSTSPTQPPLPLISSSPPSFPSSPTTVPNPADRTRQDGTELYRKKVVAELERIDGSLEIVRMLRSKGISPSIRTCNALICEVSRGKGSFAGYGVFKEVFGLESCELEGKVRRGFRVTPNVHGFNESMVGFYKEGYAKLGNEDMAAVLRKEMSVAQKQQQED